MYMLLVKIKNINKNANIGNKDWFSKNDLYVKIILGDQTRRTRVWWDNNSPAWNETFLFEESVIDQIKFELYDADKWSPDEIVDTTEFFINRCEMNIKSVTVGFLNIEIGDVFTEKKKELGLLLKKKTLLDIKLEKIQHVFNMKNEKDMGVNLN